MYCLMFLRKFGQKPDKDQHKIIDTNAEFQDFLGNPEIIMKDVRMLDTDDRNDESLLLVYKDSLETNIENMRTNIIIASYVTMYGRIMLYKLLNQLDSGGGEVLYFDTVIFRKQYNL